MMAEDSRTVCSGTCSGIRAFTFLCPTDMIPASQLPFSHIFKNTLPVKACTDKDIQSGTWDMAPRHFELLLALTLDWLS